MNGNIDKIKDDPNEGFDKENQIIDGILDDNGNESEVEDQIIDDIVDKNADNEFETEDRIIDDAVEDQIKARGSSVSKLKKEMDTFPADNQGHHLTPVQHFSHPFVKSAIEAGYDANENIAFLPKTEEASLIEDRPSHANHPKYNAQIGAAYDKLQQYSEDKDKDKEWDGETIKSALSHTELQVALKLKEMGGGQKVNDINLDDLDIDHIADSANKKYNDDGESSPEK